MRKILSVLLLFCFVGSAVAQAPQIDVRPNPVDKSVFVDERSKVDVTFENLDNQDKVINLTLPSTEYLSWKNPEKFNISAGGRKTKTAYVNESAPPEIIRNDTVVYPFKYNSSSGITFNKNDYPKQNWSINSSYPPTSISFDTLTTNFRVQLGEIDSGFFAINNLNGNYKAYDVQFKGKYIHKFSDEGFNIPAGDEKNIQYYVKIPKPSNSVEATKATNQTYETSVTIQGENFNQTSFPVSIEVPYKDYSQNFQKGDFGGLFESFQSFCNNNPSECNITDTVVRNNTVVKNRTVPVESNLTKEQIAKLVKIAEKGAGNTEQIRQEINLLKTLVKDRFQSFEQELNDAQQRAREAEREANRTRALLRELQQERQQSRKSASQAFIMLFIGTIFGGFLIGIGYFGWKYYKRQQDFRVIPDE